MEDQIDHTNFCADLVSAREYEFFVLLLLRKERAKWFSVAGLIAEAGVNVPDSDFVGPELYAAWLDHPAGAADYVTIIFYDYESKWTLGADYNRQRLFAGK